MKVIAHARLAVSLFALALLVLPACEPEPAGPAADPGAEPAAPVAEEGAPAAQPGTSAVLTAMQGEWTIELTDADRRQLEMMRLAFRDPPPSDADLEAAGLGADEKMMVNLMAAAKARDPQDPKVVEMQAALVGMEQATLTVTPEVLTLTAGALSKPAPYTVKSATDATVTVETIDAKGVPEVTTITLEGPDVLVLTDITNARRTQRFRRKGSAAPAAAPAEAPSAPTAEVPTSGAL